MNLAQENTWFSRFVTFTLALVVGISATYWVLQWVGVPAFSVPTVTDTQAPAGANAAAVARVLGGAAASAVAQPEDANSTSLTSSRFSLVGVVAQGGAAGAALIAVDGLRARPFVVGAMVADAWVLHSLKPRQAVLVRPSAANGQLAAGDAALVLQMPPVTEVKISN